MLIRDTGVCQGLLQSLGVGPGILRTPDAAPLADVEQHAYVRTLERLQEVGEIPPVDPEGDGPAHLPNDDTSLLRGEDDPTLAAEREARQAEVGFE